MEIIQRLLPTSQIINERTTKGQIVIHHTASGEGVDGDINYWKSTEERVGTHFIIGRDGKIYQTANLDNWCYHLGLKISVFKKYGLPIHTLDKHAIGIELDNWGALSKVNNEWYTYTNKKIPLENVQIYNEPFRGYIAFEKYPDVQIEALKELIISLGNTNHLLRHYNKDMWDFSVNAIKGAPGIWGHISYRTDKTDPHPQPSLVNMLSNLYA